MPAGVSLSVLVIDREPAILELISGILAQNGIRALGAQTAGEALAIAALGYVPIDLLLCNQTLGALEGVNLVARIRVLRPGIGAVYMAARIDAKVIRIQVLSEDAPVEGEAARYRGLVETIRRCCQRPGALGASPA